MSALRSTPGRSFAYGAWNQTATDEVTSEQLEEICWPLDTKVGVIANMTNVAEGPDAFAACYVSA